MSNSEGTIEEEVATVSVKRPHMFVLGAGASRAACQEGDLKGQRLPLMTDFALVLGLEDLLRSWGLDPARNIEDTFSDLHSQGETQKIRKLEERIEQFFETLSLPKHPTIYDHLLLSLRDKDVVATFNWDPLLVQAYRRNVAHAPSLPKLAFLHGNVMAGYCASDKVVGVAGLKCHCGKPFVRSRLLYPIGNKDYVSDPFIALQWELLKEGYRNAFMVTVFGYGAPKTDVAAVDAMKHAWGEPAQRHLEQYSIITTQNKKEVLESWAPFIHTHHYEIHANFYDSWLANHPRRTGEAYMAQYLDAKFIPDHPIPQNLDFPELWRWYEQFRAPEVMAGLALT